YARLEDQCRDAARRLRSGESAPVEDSPGEWAPFRPLRQLLAPELRRGRDTANPFARMILACRSLNLRLWFFSRVIAPLAPSAQGWEENWSRWEPFRADDGSSTSTPCVPESSWCSSFFYCWWKNEVSAFRAAHRSPSSRRSLRARGTSVGRTRPT